MANLIDQKFSIQSPQNSIFIQRLKQQVHQQLKKKTIIFTITNQNTKFHYYTILHPEKYDLIQLYWVTDFLPSKFSAIVSFSAYRILGIPIRFEDLRTKIEINYVLRLLNKSLPYYLTFVLNQKNEIHLSFQRTFQHQSQRNVLLSTIKQVIDEIHQYCFQSFSYLLPFLSIPIELHFKKQTKNDSNQHEKLNDLDSDEFLLVKLKNTFDRFRQKKEKTSDLIYEQKDILKAAKKIESSFIMLGQEMRCFNNFKYTVKQLKRDKLFQSIDKQNPSAYIDKVGRIAYQFQILGIQDDQKNMQMNANSQIFVGKYNFRIFKTLIEQQRTKSLDFTKSTSFAQYEQTDIIQQRISILVKKKANGKLSEKAIRNEISFLKFMRNQICPYIANYYLPLENSSNQLFVQHYQESLLNFIVAQTKEDEKGKITLRRLEIMTKIAKGLKFLSDMNICHRDVKPSNIMINHQNDPKIIDFGSSISALNQKLFLALNQKLCATEGYYSKYEDCSEQIKFMFDKKQYQSHPLFDSYSYGVLMEKFFEREISENYTNSVIKDCLIFIAKRCQQKNPDNRLNFDEILSLLIIIQRILINPINKSLNES